MHVQQKSGVNAIETKQLVTQPTRSIHFACIVCCNNAVAAHSTLHSSLLIIILRTHLFFRHKIINIEDG